MDWFTLSPDEWDAIRLSLRVATVGTLFSVPAGLFIAYALARWRFPGKFLVDGLVHLPLVLPPVVTGYILLLLFGRHGPIGAFLYERFGFVLAFRSRIALDGEAYAYASFRILSDLYVAEGLR